MDSEDENKILVPILPAQSDGVHLSGVGHWVDLCPGRCLIKSRYFEEQRAVVVFVQLKMQSSMIGNILASSTG